MDAQNPTPPPEALLLKEALRRTRMSGREAARRAGVSDTWWRAIVNGHQTIGGVRAPVTAPDDTLADMAQAVGVTPDELREAGRAGAAELLAEAGGANPVAGPASSAQVDAIATLLAGLPPEAQEEVLRRVGLATQAAPAAPAEEVTRRQSRRRRAG
ncbi:helix-turn-helix domain-containing protein [Streptomyces sp. AGS-58]|uniref:helix-turn-helix domain-containing protein n=1 Tax=unclassified Streptomyces TaxID=2593676 RepID=UPI0035A33097